ncbi:DUF418 domain-containing protein [Parashewanella curva]|uniref:DUF418 domain-containing protein n=1 Tax=Parashewanella curva TaxID=2338552 RepID=A0A3L8PT17_9GAMM|nr:DUF418 domain-containing protein [Parashewanella curva]RLV58535.1 DUF418 domain-containing protein [Parashewanella curva]
MPRIDSIDTLRGFALLGLPLMNLLVFAAPMAAYINPNVHLSDSPLNHFIFSFLQIFADQKFMGIFSVLFGVGLVLLYEKLKQQDEYGTGTIYLRLAVLMVFGFLHATYLWSGDILLIYAIGGMLIYPFIGAGKKSLLVVFSFFYVLVILLSTLASGFDSSELTPLAKYQIDVYFNPSHVQNQAILDIFLGSMDEIHRFYNTVTLDGQELDLQAALPIGMFSFAAIFRAYAMMLLGIFLYKTGFATGLASIGKYRFWSFFGLLIGGVITAFGLVVNYGHDFNDAGIFFSYGNVFVTLGSPLMVVGYIALFHLPLHKGQTVWSVSFARVGKMALSFYLLQSVICVSVFYGVGLGWFGSLARWELLLFAIGLALLQLSIAKVWLTYFKQGPMEWLWRSITYRQLAPCR